MLSGSRFGLVCFYKRVMGLVLIMKISLCRFLSFWRENFIFFRFGERGREFVLLQLVLV